MRKPDFARTFRRILAAALCLAAALACSDRRNALRPNVVVVVVDTLRFDHLGLYGYERRTSSKLDAFASDAIVMETSYSNAPWTKPSVASLFTSLRPSQHGAEQESSTNRLADSLITLPEVFRDTGYETVGISENPHVGADTGFAQGFERFVLREGFGADSAWVVKEMSRWFRERPTRRPFFLYLHFLDPHGPYASSIAQDFLDGRTTENPHVASGRVGQLAKDGGLKAPISDSDREYLEALYDAEIRNIDLDIESIFELLRENEVWEDSIVLVTSDHGEEFLDHGSLRHGYWLYDEALRVPMIWRVPGMKARRIPERVEHIDIAPTLLDLIGIDEPLQFQGRSLRPLFSGGALPPAPTVAQTSWRGIDRDAVRDDRWKLIVDFVGGTRELYDLQNDPDEKNDLSIEEAERVARLEKLLEKLSRRPEDVSLEGARGEADPDLERSLRALGYLSDREE